MRRMALGKRTSEQTPLWIPTTEVPMSSGHPFSAPPVLYAATSSTRIASTPSSVVRPSKIASANAIRRRVVVGCSPVVADDHVSSMKELVCDGQPIADSADQHAQSHELTSARIVSSGSSPWWPVIALVRLFCPWTEHHEARCEEQQSDEHDAPAPHGQADDAGVDAWFIRDPRVLHATGRAHRGVASDQCRAQSAGDGVSRYFGHATTPLKAHEEDRRVAMVVSSSYFTKTHSGLSSGNAIRPMIAVAATSRGLLTFQRNKTTRLPSATSVVSQSPIAIFPSRTQAPRIVPMAAA